MIKILLAMTLEINSNYRLVRNYQDNMHLCTDVCLGRDSYSQKSKQLLQLCPL